MLHCSLCITVPTSGPAILKQPRLSERKVNSAMAPPSRLAPRSITRWHHHHLEEAVFLATQIAIEKMSIGRPAPRTITGNSLVPDVFISMHRASDQQEKPQINYKEKKIPAVFSLYATNEQMRVSFFPSIVFFSCSVFELFSAMHKRRSTEPTVS